MTIFNDTFTASPSMLAPMPSPFSKISTKLLRAIFEHVCDNDAVHIPLQPLDPRYALSLVCRRWVITVRSTSALWVNVHFTKHPLDKTHNSDPLLHHFSLCVERSGQRPLTITFDMFCDGWAFSVVGSVIIPNIHRIRSLRCPVYHNNDIIQFLTMAEGQFSILESMEICLINTWDSPASSFSLDDCLLFNALRTAPRLRKATFYLLNGLHPIDLRLPWGQLTTLDLGTTAMLPEELIKILHSAALHLEAGHFCVRFNKLLCPKRVLWRSVVKMHALRTLRLRLLYPSVDTRLFSLLRFPSLQRLWLEMHDTFQDWDLALYTKLLRASTRTLRRLYLIDYPSSEGNSAGFKIKQRYSEITPQTLEKFFKVVPNVESLHLPLGIYIHPQIVDKVASYTRLPMLRELDLCTIHGWYILSMAKQRHEHFSNAALASASEFEVGSSQRHPPMPLVPLEYIYMQIPRSGYSVRAKRALVEEAQALALLGITCHVLSTTSLPLPIIKPTPVVSYIPQHQLPV
ncbi:hypothetical protein BJ912DRAFT_928558 [Pholiota molesta]|nr:hypothetical protein BJ912DRAFT_928558 [Pholiota molesta]